MSNITSATINKSTMQTVTLRHEEEAIVASLFPRQEQPTSSAQLTAQLQELLQLLNPDQPKPAGPVYRNRFLIRKGHQFISLPVTEVRYFYSKEKICFVKTNDNRDYVVPFTITEIEEMISPDMFFRASRKYIISHSAITKILVWFNGKLKVEIQPNVGEEIIISRERVNNFKVWLGE
ncbi:LytTR family DNA-binding domain-containing protein [Paraflavitalea sp. CAU 1676]|uniref:LytR/AlgR family response regulator transcription factor n=1 Tax=Paraflavitalea sp. CAU 1676 TaxID=3032598 RepID=UPI0023DA0BCA|nr:LytTR family DNA-binding domain-containing protein [Paraflavitalea sp. CAU 1676]MDF2192264.1 LytTR family DNA-binding domain-containing protein [Paraflavitalea sp. CAU 1676]